MWKCLTPPSQILTRVHSISHVFRTYYGVRLKTLKLQSTVHANNFTVLEFQFFIFSSFTSEITHSTPTWQHSQYILLEISAKSDPPVSLWNIHFIVSEIHMNYLDGCPSNRKRCIGQNNYVIWLILVLLEKSRC